MANCYITLDYELCLGCRTGTAEGCLIRPMEALTKMLDKYGIKVNVMVDAAYLYRMNQLKDADNRIAEEFKLVSDNVRNLANQGHAIQFHFHSQWIHTEFVDGHWKMDMEHYKLSDLPHEEMLHTLSDALDLLNSISGQKAVAYRAVDGLPLIEHIILKLKEKGIKVDTSVLRYSKTKTKFQTYDYSKVPNKTSYPFSRRICNEDSSGSFTEYPISVKPYNSISYLLMKRRLKSMDSNGLSKERWNDGIGAGYPGGKLTALKIKLKKFLGRNVLYASFDGELALLLPEIFNYSQKKYKGDDFVIISHPKLFTPSAIANLEKFVKETKNVEYKLFE